MSTVGPTVLVAVAGEKHDLGSMVEDVFKCSVDPLHSTCSFSTTTAVYFKWKA